MIDGGMMSLPTCGETLASCGADKATDTDCCANSRLVTTERGPCYRMWADGRGRGDRDPGDSGDANLGFYLEGARGDLDLRVELSGTSSARVGFPVVTSRYFGSRYLCDDTWGEREADVICKSLGFTGGVR